jgi:hypothetical protein
MESEIIHLRKRLKDEGEKVSSFFESLSPEDWAVEVYTEGSRWHVRQILAHFISTELVYQRSLEDVLQGGNGAAFDLDIDQFNETEVAGMGPTPIGELLAGYRDARQKTLDLTKKMSESDLTRMATHPWFGEREVGWLLRLVYRHNTLHLQDIRKAILSGEPVPHTDAHRVGRNINPPS